MPGAPHRNTNQRKGRQGAFWEDRYHATATSTYTAVYTDLNMVRAGAVEHPSQWAHCGYREIQEPRERYSIIDLRELSSLCGFQKVADFQQAYRQWVSEALTHEIGGRDERWSEAIAVGGLTFVEKVRSESDLKPRIAK